MPDPAGPYFPLWWPGTTIENTLTNAGSFNKNGLALNEEAVTTIIGYELYSSSRKFGQPPAFGQAEVTSIMSS
jgi:hypothetical protein